MIKWIRINYDDKTAHKDVLESDYPFAFFINNFSTEFMKKYVALQIVAYGNQIDCVKTQADAWTNNYDRNQLTRIASINNIINHNDVVKLIHLLSGDKSGDPQILNAYCTRLISILTLGDIFNKVNMVQVYYTDRNEIKPLE